MQSEAERGVSPHFKSLPNPSLSSGVQGDKPGQGRQEGKLRSRKGRIEAWSAGQLLTTNTQVALERGL